MQYYTNNTIQLNFLMKIIIKILKIYSVLITFTISSCGCLEATLCNCPEETLILEFNFDKTKPNCFPNEMSTVFHVITINEARDTMDITEEHDMFNQKGIIKSLSINYGGGDYYGDNKPSTFYSGFTHFIENESLQFVDTISYVSFEFIPVRCITSEQPKRCSFNECKDVDLSTLTFKYNGVEYCYDDMPVQVNYYGPEY